MVSKSKRWILRTGAVGGFLVILAFCFSWLVGSALVAPAHRPAVLPAAFSGSEVAFPSGSGATLRGNFLKGQAGRGVVVLMHGVRGARADMAQHAEFLHLNGFSVLLFDFQAHGESSGQKN